MEKEFYKLKHKYEESIRKQKKSIIANNKYTLKDKKKRISKIIPRCIECNKPGGTDFIITSCMLKAVCKHTTPCSLNINIQKKNIPKC